MRLVLQTANVVSDAKNCLYPNRVEAGNAAELQEAIKKDHVCGEYKKNYRSKENFIRSNVAVMDCDKWRSWTVTTITPRIRKSGSRRRRWKSYSGIFPMQ